MTASEAANPRPLIERVLRPFQRFIATEAASGIVLLAATAIALVWANSGWAASYHHLWEIPLTIGMPGYGLTMSLHHWVNDGLMAVFFFLVGLEIKREVLEGDLSTRRSATLPVVAAAGGMLVPAALYTLLNFGGAGRAGWGIPMATDIAFALGILALLGSRVPSGLRVFLAALAIADDLGAVLVIAFFYTSALYWPALGGAGAVVAVLVALNAAGARRPITYAILGVVLWRFVLASGIHATIAGVVLALMVPARQHVSEDAAVVVQPPLQRMEHALQGVVAFVIMPIFALANAGVPLGKGVSAAALSPIAWGIVLGLVLGKPIGIGLASYLAVRLRAADLPPGVSWRHLHGAGWLGGIGFTMSLFVAALAFRSPEVLNVAKLGILAASVTAGVIGFVILRYAGSRDAMSDRDA
ncbi:MAG TPA: Na+/H+ antiporter NhaA [Gemmatimonadaceae bacterium]|nr:Na+/H+ antiporter NhaA [Gemmatimonadaceae bacterium]